MKFIPFIGVRASGKTTLMSKIKRKGAYNKLLGIEDRNRVGSVSASKLQYSFFNSKFPLLCQMGYVVNKIPFDFEASLIFMYGEPQTEVILSFLDRSFKIVLLTPPAEVVLARMKKRAVDSENVSKMSKSRKWNFLADSYSEFYRTHLGGVYEVLHNRFPRALIYDGYTLG